MAEEQNIKRVSRRISAWFYGVWIGSGLLVALFESGCLPVGSLAGEDMWGYCLQTLGVLLALALQAAFLPFGYSRRTVVLGIVCWIAALAALLLLLLALGLPARLGLHGLGLGDLHLLQDVQDVRRLERLVHPPLDVGVVRGRELGGRLDEDDLEVDVGEFLLGAGYDVHPVLVPDPGVQHDHVRLEGLDLLDRLVDGAGHAHVVVPLHEDVPDDLLDRHVVVDYENLHPASAPPGHHDGAI